MQLQLTKGDHEAERCATSIHRHQQPLPVTPTAEDPEVQDHEDISVSAVSSAMVVLTAVPPAAVPYVQYILEGDIFFTVWDV